MNVIYKKIFYTTNKIEIQDLWTDNLFLYFSDQSDVEIDTTIQWLISEKDLKNKTFRPKTFTQKIKKNIRKIEIKENYSNIYIFHGHNNSYFYLYNNDICIKKHAILGHKKVKEGYAPYQDRMFFNKIKSPQIGFISFSEPIYVDSIVVEK